MNAAGGIGYETRDSLGTAVQSLQDRGGGETGKRKINEKSK